MTGVDLPVALPWASFAVTWFVLGLAVLIAHRLLRRLLGRVDPAQASLVLFALAMLPLSTALIVVVLGFVPSIGGLVVDSHCHDATGCGTHVPMLRAEGPAAALWLIAIPVVTAVGVALLIGMLRRSVTVARVLEAIASPSGERPAFRIIESAQVFACCTGLLRPRILLSRGLLDSLPRPEFAAVLAHEQAHARRRDNLRRLLVAISLWPLPRRWRRDMASDLSAATEAACDAAAVRSTRDLASVARALAALGAASGSGSLACRSCAGDATPGTGAHAGTELRFPLAVPAAAIVMTYVVTSVASTRLAHHVAEFLLR